MAGCSGFVVVVFVVVVVVLQLLMEVRPDKRKCSSVCVSVNTFFDDCQSRDLRMLIVATTVYTPMNPLHAQHRVGV